MADGGGLPPNVPDSRAVGRKHTRLSLVWIVPIVAAIAGAWVAVTRILAEGPTITIVFKSAEGLDAGHGPGDELEATFRVTIDVQRFDSTPGTG